MNHTPGPWNVDLHDMGGFDITAPNSRGWPSEIVLASRSSHEARADEMHANGKLMAAAPKLLEAAYIAKGMLARQLDKHGYAPDSWGDDEHEAFVALEAAIAKAEDK